jgi:quercetin dioxygenase-like cupin family protein
MAGGRRARRIVAMTTITAPHTTENIWFIDALVHVHVSGEDTGGEYALLELLLPPGETAPQYLHAGDMASFLVLEGEVTLHSAFGETILRPGEATHSPAGGRHVYEVTSAGAARMIVICAPTGFLEYVRAVGRPARYPALPASVTTTILTEA